MKRAKKVGMWVVLAAAFLLSSEIASAITTSPTACYWTGLDSGGISTDPCTSNYVIAGYLRASDGRINRYCCTYPGITVSSTCTDSSYDDDYGIACSSGYVARNVGGGGNAGLAWVRCCSSNVVWKSPLDWSKYGQGSSSNTCPIRESRDINIGSRFHTGDGDIFLKCTDICIVTTEICDNKDNDCDGQTDEGCDNDNDNYCDKNMKRVGTPTTCTSGGLDCNDNDNSIHPNAAETCGDGIDQDCNGADLQCACVDADNDGYNVSYCGGGDCDDTNPAIHPGALDICNDGIDQDCSGADTTVCACVDADGDTYNTTAACSEPGFLNLIPSYDAQIQLKPGPVYQVDSTSNNIVLGSQGRGLMKFNTQPLPENLIIDAVILKLYFKEIGSPQDYLNISSLENDPTTAPAGVLYYDAVDGTSYILTNQFATLYSPIPLNNAANDIKSNIARGWFGLGLSEQDDNGNLKIKSIDAGETKEPLLGINYHTRGIDCDDTNANIYPNNPNTYCDCDLTDGYDKGMAEICDYIDNDCDGQIDETFDKMTDSSNCGSCGNVCASGVCEAGQCKCVLDSAQWIYPAGSDTVSDGRLVTMQVAGTDCEGQDIIFHVWEDDTSVLGLDVLPFMDNILDDEIMENDPSPAAFAGGMAAKKWPALYNTTNLDGVTKTEAGQPEYYFRAVASDGTEIKSSNLLRVKGNLPPVEPAPFLLEPRGGEFYDKNATVRWNPAIDPDGDPVFYILQYSADGGNSFFPLKGAYESGKTYGYVNEVEVNGANQSEFTMSFG